jgi:hypothetical protein
MVSDWDQGLPDLDLDNVRIHANSLSEAWKNTSTEYLVRSVLVAEDRPLDEMPFGFSSARFKVKDLYDAIAANYDLAWIQDDRMGVAWFYPVEQSYKNLLSAVIHVPLDHFALPMQSGILEPLGIGNTAGIIVKQWGSVFQNTFDYAVDVPAGEYTIRDILNLCCVANPTKTFFVQPRGGEVFVTAVNLVPDMIHSEPVGALHLWDVEIGQKYSKNAPTRKQVIAALAHPAARVRSIARNYLEAIIWRVQEEWMDLASSTEQALWMCLGVNSILVRSGEATSQTSIEMMERLATEDFLSECEAELAVVTALDLARLTKDTKALDVIINRKFRAEELVGAISDACRVAALSGYVRKALQEKRAEALVGALPPLDRMIHSPNAGKLGYRPAGVH